MKEFSISWLSKMKQLSHSSTSLVNDSHKKFDPSCRTVALVLDFKNEFLTSDAMIFYQKQVLNLIGFLQNVFSPFYKNQVFIHKISFGGFRIKKLYSPVMSILSSSHADKISQEQFRVAKHKSNHRIFITISCNPSDIAKFNLLLSRAIYSKLGFSPNVLKFKIIRG